MAAKTPLNLPPWPRIASERTDGLANTANITVGPQLGRAEVFNGLRNCLNMDRPEHHMHSIDQEMRFISASAVIAGGVKVKLLAIWFCGNRSMAKGAPEDRLAHLSICRRRTPGSPETACRQRWMTGLAGERAMGGGGGGGVRGRDGCGGGGRGWGGGRLWST